jgi:hypothetical protein
LNEHNERTAATERRQCVAETVIINSIVYEVLETREGGTLVVCHRMASRPTWLADCLTIRCTEPIAVRS